MHRHHIEVCAYVEMYHRMVHGSKIRVTIKKKKELNYRDIPAADRSIANLSVRSSPDILWLIAWWFGAFRSAAWMCISRKMEYDWCTEGNCNVGGTMTASVRAS